MPGTYDRLTRTQKLATFLIVIGPEAAAHLLKQFEDEDVEILCKEMTSINAIEEVDQKRAIEEFSSVILSKLLAFLSALLLLVIQQKLLRKLSKWSPVRSLI